MFESLRVRLVLWYALVLVTVVAMYGSAVCYQFWRSMLDEMDRELDARARQVAAALQPVAEQRFDLELPTEALEYFRQGGGVRYYAIWNDRAELVAGSNPDLAVSFPRGPARTEQGRREVSSAAPGGATVLVGRDAADLREAMWSLTLNVTLAGAGMLALAILGGWFVAGRALAPIVRISRVARAMSDGDLDARIPIERTETELGQVALTLNDAFDRLRLAVQHERRFIADASHELRTPLSILRAEVDATLARDQPAARYRDSLVVCRRAIVRMQTIVERLLSLARAEDGRRHGPARRTPVPLEPLVHEVTAWLAPLAEERGVRVAIAGSARPVAGDPSQLREALENIVCNAIVYNRPGGSVTVSLTTAEDEVRIVVADTGRGIPAASLPFVFDRFFRVDQARARTTGGAGLGLAVARSIVEGHGGTISCTSEEGRGSVFVITLPAVPAISPRGTAARDPEPLFS